MKTTVRYIQGLLVVATGMVLPCVAIAAIPQSADSIHVLDKIERHNADLSVMDVSVYANPALRQFKYVNSLTTVAVGYDIMRQSKAVSTQAGDGDDKALFDATTYIKYKNSALWGNGCYSNGHVRFPVWNEVADAELVYPYLTADSIGGDMKREIYRFSGGLASRIGNFVWGVELGYQAGQYYRDVDPRPRNITGKLDISAGAGCVIGNYVLAVSGTFMTYKQTSDIDFMSELGQTPIYHLTGLGSDYVRFRGNGMNTHYKGNRFGGSIDIVSEDRNGLFASVKVARFTLETILSDMNKLPMSSLWHNSIDAAAGFRRSSGSTAWQVACGFNAYRRHGKENVFGDPASSTYPQIGTLELYADNHWKACVSGLYEVQLGRLKVSYKPLFAYSHRCQVYADPGREWLVDHITTSHTLTARGRLSSRWYGNMGFGWSLYSPVKSNLGLNDYESGLPLLMEALESDFVYASSTQRSYYVSASAAYALNRRNTLRFSADYERCSYVRSTFGNKVSVSAALIF